MAKNTTEIKPCGCGENEYLQVLPKFNKQQVFCVNCGNTGHAMSTKELAIEDWNKSTRLHGVIKQLEYVKRCCS